MKSAKQDNPYDEVAFTGWPPDRSAFIALCGDDYGEFDLLESYIHSKSGEITHAEQARAKAIEMLDRILSKFEAKDHAYRYVNAIKKLVISRG